MTDNEIIKALECHADRDIETCSLCPLMCVEGCAYELAKNSLDLINRQKAEIENQSHNIRKLTAESMQLQTIIGDLQHEIRNLKCEKGQLEGTQKYLVEQAKVEAVKKFAVRLKKEMSSREIIYGMYEFIDNLVKEMVGESNA